MAQLIFKIFLTVLFTMEVIACLVSVARGTHPRVEKPIRNAIASVVIVIIIGLLWYLF